MEERLSIKCGQSKKKYDADINQLRSEAMAERTAMSLWSDRVVQLQQLLEKIQERITPQAQEIVELQLAVQNRKIPEIDQMEVVIEELQQALQNQGVHTENRLRRIEKILQALRVQAEVQETLREVKIN